MKKDSERRKQALFKRRAQWIIERPLNRRMFTKVDLQAKVNKEKEEAYDFIEKERREKIELAEKVRNALAEKRRSEVNAFCENLAREGKLLPAWQKMGIREFIHSLDSSQPLRFAEGVRKSQSQWFMNFLRKVTRLIP